MEQLDEHLSGKEVYSPPSFIQVVSTFFIYSIILIVSIILYYATFESYGLLKYSILEQDIYGVLISDIIISLIVYFILIFSNYYLQGRLYKIFHQSVFKTTLIPILFWSSIILSCFIYAPPENNRLSSLIAPFVRISAVIIGYGILCLIISHYFKDQNKMKYYITLFIYWFVALSFFLFLL